MGFTADLAAHIERLEKLRAEVGQVKAALPAVAHALPGIAVGFENAQSILDTALAAETVQDEDLVRAADALVAPGCEYDSSQKQLDDFLKAFADEKAAAKAAAEAEARAMAAAAAQVHKGKHKKGNQRGSRSVPPPRAAISKDEVDSGEVADTQQDDQPRTAPKKKHAGPVDMSIFVQARWEAEKKRAIALGSGAGSSCTIYRDIAPKPQMDMKVCIQVRGNHILTNTEEKIQKVYQELEKISSSDRVGFLLGASLVLFQKLAQERSDCTSKAKGGDLGWFGKGDKERMLVDTAFLTPKGACSPPVRSNLGFHVFYCQDRKI